MNTKNLFYTTLTISVIIQLLTGGLEIFTLFESVPTSFILIKQLLLLEVIVQLIEGMFYLWLVFNLNSVTNITPKRYIDWVITTPTMIVTLIFYLIYLNNKDNIANINLSFFDLLINNSNTISIVLLLNWLMLIFGYLGETKIIPTLTGVLLGFIPFIIYYLIIYINYVKTELGFNMFIYFLFFWSLYGIVALLPYYLKNALYNILDIFAKNFFGVFLSYIILTKNY
jgi:hypothetical protein